jgi:hypothetical protein
MWNWECGIGNVESEGMAHSVIEKWENGARGRLGKRRRGIGGPGKREIM